MADDLFAVVDSGQVKIHIDQRYAARRCAPGASRPRGAQDDRLEHLTILKVHAMHHALRHQGLGLGGSTEAALEHRRPSTIARSTPRRGQPSPGLERAEASQPDWRRSRRWSSTTAASSTEVAAILIHLGLAHPAERPRWRAIRRSARSRSAAWSTSPPTATPASASSTIPSAGIPTPTTRSRRRCSARGRARLHELWEIFADQFPATPWLSGERLGALDIPRGDGVDVERRAQGAGAVAAGVLAPARAHRRRAAHRRSLGAPLAAAMTRRRGDATEPAASLRTGAVAARRVAAGRRRG